MKGEAFKALSHEEMVSHPIFKGWVSRPFHKETSVRGIVQENSCDSKK